LRIQPKLDCFTKMMESQKMDTSTLVRDQEDWRPNFYDSFHASLLLTTKMMKSVLMLFFFA